MSETRRCRWFGHKWEVLVRKAEGQPWSRWGIWMEEYDGPCVRCGEPPPKETVDA